MLSFGRYRTLVSLEAASQAYSKAFPFKKGLSLYLEGLILFLIPRAFSV